MGGTLIARTTMKKEVEWKYVGIRLKPITKKHLEKLAQREERSINQYLSLLIEQKYAEKK
jgi:predicted HicB family RNase H-like nuclease